MNTRIGERCRSILVCDGELQGVRALKTVLRDAGFGVFATQTAGDALRRTAMRMPDAIILETTLRDASGAEVCRRIRLWSSVPIIIVSQVSDEDQIVEAFAAGATDYVTKPFRPRELVARLEAHLRNALVAQPEPVLEYGSLRIDLAARVVRRAGEEIRLTPIEYKLLCALLRQRGRLLTHDTLLRAVWGAAYAGDRQTLRAHMSNLRRKLASPPSAPLIHTYPGVGYLFADRERASCSTPAMSTTGSIKLQVARAV